MTDRLKGKDRILDKSVEIGEYQRRLIRKRLMAECHDLGYSIRWIAQAWGEREHNVRYLIRDYRRRNRT